MKKCKITPQLIKKARANVKLGFTYASLARSLGIAEDTLYLWFRKARDEGTEPYVSFVNAVRESESELLEECLEQLKTSMRTGNIESTKWLMERRFFSEYGKKSTQDVKVVSENINHNFNTKIDNRTPDQIRADILQKLNRKSFSPDRAYIPQSIEE